MSDKVRYETDGAVAIVTIDRPEVRNAVDSDTAEALLDAFTRFDADEGLCTAVLTGSGGYFCAGADLKAVSTRKGNRVREDVSEPGPLGVSRMLLGKPVIAAVEGHATNDKGLIESALSLVNTAIADLADYRNELGNTLLTLDDTNSRHRDFVVYLDNQISNIEDVDITEAIIRLTENQTILEASFLTVSRLSNLNLSDFLR